MMINVNLFDGTSNARASGKDSEEELVLQTVIMIKSKYITITDKKTHVKNTLVSLFLIFIAYMFIRKPNNYVIIDDTAKHSINDRIISFKHMHDFYAQGFYIIFNNDNNKLYLFNEDGDKKPKNRKYLSGGDLLRINDSISKRRNSKRVTVYRNKRFVFDFYIE